MKLINENTGFLISTTGVEATYSDDGKLLVSLCARKENDEKNYFLLNVEFYNVAEISCKSINFYESNYENYTILSNSKQDNINTSGFYIIKESERLKVASNMYDPRKRLNLKHYLLTGTDSYLEVIASSYSIQSSIEPT
jgi:hypothetical protein